MPGLRTSCNSREAITAVTLTHHSREGEPAFPFAVILVAQSNFILLVWLP